MYEQADKVGGRVQTEEKGGFMLDRGFQVYLTAYPETSRLLDLDALRMGTFAPGAMLLSGPGFYRVMDVFREPKAFLETVTAPIGNLFDKALVGLLRTRMVQKTEEKIWAGRDRTTYEYLRKWFFSHRMIDCFFRRFYGGIFLEKELRTSARMFQFTFKMFSEGHAALPAGGMQRIPEQLAERLPEGSVRLGQKVMGITEKSVTLEGGEVIEGSQVVLATEGDSPLRPDGKSSDWRGVTTWYFQAERSPLPEPIIALSSSDETQLNSVCVPSDIASGYAPEGKSLISVTSLELKPTDDISKELKRWFGPISKDWKLLDSYEIKKGLPEQGPDFDQVGFTRKDGVYCCGDWAMGASIEGAVRSGLSVARAICSETDGLERN